MKELSRTTSASHLYIRQPVTRESDNHSVPLSQRDKTWREAVGFSERRLNVGGILVQLIT